MSHIDLRSDGRRILLPIKVLRPRAEDMTAVGTTALLDTGATSSGISVSIAEELSLPAMGKRPMGSARGLDLTERYLFRIGIDSAQSREPAFPFLFAPVLGFEIVRGSSFDALLGMDVLNQCDLTLRRDGSCRLEFG